jgi:hypothetical protein
MTQIFVLFHRNLFDEIYKDVPDDILNKYFTFVGVNEKIQKDYTPNKYNIINEWELPIYNPALQEKGFLENSTINHIYINNLHKPYTHVGFLHYDMLFGNDYIDIITSEDKEDFYAHAHCDYDFAFKKSVDGRDVQVLNFMLQDYENYFKTQISKTKIYGLNNCYLITSNMFDAVMDWGYKMSQKLLISDLPHSECCFAGIFERAMALSLSERFFSPKLLPVVHNHDFKSRAY